MRGYYYIGRQQNRSETDEGQIEKEAERWVLEERKEGWTEGRNGVGG